MSSAEYGVWHAEDFEGENGGACIQAAVIAAEATPGNNVVMVGPMGPDVDGRWEVSQTIELPSHTTLILQGAYMVLADWAVCDLIQNRDYIEGNADIHVIGRGGARLDLNPSHQPQPPNHREDEIWMEEQGMPLSTVTKELIGDLTVAEYAAHHREIPYMIVGMRFYNVKNLSLRGFTIGPAVSFPLHIERVQNVRISDCTVAQDGHWSSQEFIHVYGPAERVVIDNIVGGCSDDICALTTSESLLSTKGWGGDKLPDDVRWANAGPIHGVVISNIIVRNLWCTGLLRVLPAPGYPIDGIHITNIQMLETPGRSLAHAVLKFGNTKSGMPKSVYMPFDACAPEDQANITIENIYVKDWVGPYIAILEPVKNLTIRGVRGSHTGALLHNYGNAIDGLTLEDCRTTLVGGPDVPFVGPMFQFHLDEYNLGGTSATGTPAAILLDSASLKDIDIRNVMVTSGLNVGDKVSGSGIAGMRLGPDAEVQSLHVSGLKIDGYESGIIVEKTRGEDLNFENITMRNVATPWEIRDADTVKGNVSFGWR